MTNELAAKDETLGRALARLRRASDRNHGVVPSGVDPTLTDVDCFPIESWRRSVRKWTDLSSLLAFCKGRRMSTIKLMQRAIEKEAKKMPRFPLTRRAAKGPDQIRLRLLASTSALNVTLSKFTDRDPVCPFGTCSGGVEDTVHFLLHCKELDKIREKFLNRLCDRCTCDRRLGEGGVQSCADFYESLDDAGKALFMLGGPVDGRTPEADIDACAREYVREAWSLRNATLNAQADDPLVKDLTRRDSKYGLRNITSFFGPPCRSNSAGIDAAGLERVVVQSRPKHARPTHARSTRFAQSTIGAFGFRRRTNGSGLNDSICVMRSN